MDTSTHPVAARLLEVQGDVWSLHADIRVALAAGMGLEAGTVVITGAGGALRLQLASGRELALDGDRCLCLDDDVLATADADFSEWRLASHADPASLADWLAPAPLALSLEHVLEPHPVLDALLGPATASVSPGGSGVPDPDDPGLAALLRSLYGPDAG
jgi:hypothetical protein